MILINTGDGKGKTTAALGVAMRALGYGKRVAMIQFIKGPWKSGEDFFAKEYAIPNERFMVIKTGKGFVGIPGDVTPFSEHQQAAKDGLVIAERLINEKQYDLIILDEICGAIGLGLIDEGEVVSLVSDAPDDLDIILTGRGASEALIACADTVTEMREIKHAYHKGVKAKEGIDF